MYKPCAGCIGRDVDCIGRDVGWVCEFDPDDPPPPPPDDWLFWVGLDVGRVDCWFCPDDELNWFKKNYLFILESTKLCLLIRQIALLFVSNLDYKILLFLIVFSHITSIH